MEEEHRLIQERVRKLNELRTLGILPYAYKFVKTHFAEDIKTKYQSLNNEEKTQDIVKIAGRIVQMRDMGKIAFAHILDSSGKIQIFFKSDDIQEKYKLLKKFDIGDIIGVIGTVFKTKTGEITIAVTDFELLTKSIRPLPDKFHGLVDQELRYRMRYVDLIMSPETKKAFIIRSKIIESMREFLTKKGFIEVETPILQPMYGGAAARPFVTYHNTLKMNLYLRISNELYLKRLLVGGFEKVFEFCRDFRNEGMDTKHNPEFTLMETMAAYWDYEDSMRCTEEMLEHIALNVLGTTSIKYGDNIIELKAPFKKIRMVDAVKDVTGVDFSNITIEKARGEAGKHNIKFTEFMGTGAIMAEIFSGLCEPNIIQPTMIIDHPKETSALAKETKYSKDFTERFELIIAGKEYGNVYSELNDPAILRDNWKRQEELLSKGDEEAQKTDDDFLKALEFGMPPASGIGIGIDRLAMLFTDSQTIRDVILFPTLRPENQ